MYVPPHLMIFLKCHALELLTSHLKCLNPLHQMKMESCFHLLNLLEECILIRAENLYKFLTASLSIQLANLFES